MLRSARPHDLSGLGTGHIAALLLTIAVALVACSSPQLTEGDSSPGTPASLIPAEDPLANPAIDGNFAVAEDGRKLAMRCWGEGSPTIVLEAGHPSEGIEDFGTDARPMVEELVSHARVCAYDRAGYGRSDPAPNEPRDADDVTNDLRALLTAADVDPPYVLVGASFGGMIVTYYASLYPQEVSAVVLLDVPAPSASLTVAEVPEIAWDHPENPEHVDVVPEFESRFARRPAAFEAPLTVITATQGQSDVEDQSFWLELSPDPIQVELEGGHDIYIDDPQGVAAEIIRRLESST
jgi:dienelactone hydrolase